MAAVLVTYVKQDLKHKWVGMSFISKKNVELQLFEVMMDGLVWWVYNAYIHVDILIVEGIWDIKGGLSAIADRHFLIACDFNACSHSWHGQQTGVVSTTG